jgi:STE24 endopeptidase
VLVEAFQYWLDYVNTRHLKIHGARIPPEFVGHIEEDLLARTRDYILEHTRFGVATSLFQNIVTLLFIFGGLLNLYNSWIASLKLPFVLSGLLFFALITYGQTLLSVPFSLYRTFKIENKFGFNTITPRLWIADFMKSFLISTILMILLLPTALWLITWSPERWWLWLWSFFFIFSLFFMYISPYVIEPLFNKFTPLEEGALEEGIRSLLAKVGIKVSRVFKMDASKRSRHTNAYFTGIGKVKRIVLYDTLIEKMTHSEILSVLAHEAGHWKKKHVLKAMAAVEVISFVGLYVSFRILEGDFLSTLFRIDDDTFFAKVVVLGFCATILAFPVAPLAAYVSRRHEREADRFSYGLTGDSEGMISALVKLSKDNLSNLHPHPLYAKFHYFHPPATERIRYIREIAKA